MINAGDFLKWLNVFNVVPGGGGGPITFPISLTHGGTSAALVANNGGIVYSTATAMAILAGTATAGQVLRSGATGAPSWSTATYPATTAINQLLYSSAANVIGGVTTANQGFLITDATGIPGIGNSILITEDLTGLANPGKPVLRMTNATGITFPTSPFSVTLGVRTEAIVNTAQTINSGSNTVNNMSFTMTNSGSGTQSLNNLTLNNLSASMTWSSANTASTMFSGNFTQTYNGSNLSGRTTTTLDGLYSTQIVTPPAAGTATIATYSGINSDMRDISSVATGVTKNFTTFRGFFATGQVTNSAASNISNITNLKLFDGAFTINGAGAGSQVNITNFIGLHLQSLTTSGTFTITNRYGIKQDDASAQNLFAGTLASKSISFSTTSGVIGSTTNDSAAAGSVGELLSATVSSAAPVALTTATAANVTSVVLTPGDWDVWGEVQIINTGGVSTSVYGWQSETSATLPALMSNRGCGGVIAGAEFLGAVAAMRVSVATATTTTVYLGAYAVFVAGTAGASGTIYARRRR